MHAGSIIGFDFTCQLAWHMLETAIGCASLSADGIEPLFFSHVLKCGAVISEVSMS